jgi:hypothetical protein
MQQLEVLVAMHRSGGRCWYNDIVHVQGSIAFATAGNVIPSAAFSASRASDEQRSRKFAHSNPHAAIKTGNFSRQPLRSYQYQEHPAWLHTGAALELLQSHGVPV